MKSLSHVPLFAAPWTVTYQAPLTMGFSRQEYWSGFHFLLQGNLPDPGIEPGSPALQASSILKAMTNPDSSILKSRDTLPTKVLIVKAMVFPKGMYGCES